MATRGVTCHPPHPPHPVGFHLGHAIGTDSVENNHQLLHAKKTWPD